ncbi:hypothetical protein V6x_42280 [Gimesia chilikensis]|uniref:Uncharacterized protein n=1 Tax=Gimesia chilikensis TaxID=2605989 RepID=A0A517WGX2_9PLAN|nr:hypothetical protein V6x_42280 [Gimesia chilikensis]
MQYDLHRITGLITVPGACIRLETEMYLLDFVEDKDELMLETEA